MALRFLPRWVLAVTVAETVGFAVAASVLGTMSLLAVPAAIVYPAMIVAGAVEGALLGLGQWVGLGTMTLSRAAWVAATAVGAAIAWSIGMLPSTIDGVDFGAPGVIALIVAGAIVLLASIPTMQWLILRRAVRPSLWWIPVNMGAWAVGILWTLAPAPFIDENTPPAALFVVYGVAGLFMALTVSCLTAVAARRLAGELTSTARV